MACSVDILAYYTYNLLMGANTKYKDSVFSFLFSDPDVLRELYCALEGITLPPDVPVTINTLQDVLYLDRVNDISFEIGDKLVILIEHQSTINPNMALRLLMYIARVYEKIIEGKKIYSTQMIKLPRPEFYVLYNGTSSYPDEKTLRLSDMYENVESLGLSNKDSPELELIVKVVNINEGRNEGIIKRCKTLAGYRAFVGKVREYEKESGSKEDAISKAVKYCLEHEILRDFFEKNAKEVMNMLITEWNMEDALAVRYEEGLGRGREEGREEEREDIARSALAKGLPVEVVHDITGLDIEMIKSIKS